MKFFGYELRKIKKRQSQSGFLGSEFSTLTQSFSTHTARRLASVHRCLKIYSDLLNLCPLKVKGDKKNHYLLNLIKKPCSFLDKNSFFSILTEQVFLYGVFRARVLFNTEGIVTALLPYKYPQLFCYTKKGQYNDSYNIETGGFYYRDHRGRILMPSEVFQVTDNFFSQDFINPVSRVLLFHKTFEQGHSILNFSKNLSASGLRPAGMLSGLDDQDDQSLKETREAVQKFTSMGEDTVGEILSLPAGFQLKNMMTEHPSNLLKLLASYNDVLISRLFGVPLSLMSGRSDGERTAGGAGSIKEDMRFFIKSALRSYLKNISDCFTVLANDGSEFYFSTDHLKSSDLREAGQFLKLLVDSNIISPSKAMDWLNLETED